MLDSAVEAPLPDIQPGALPLLEELYLQLPTLQSALPPSWGGRPDALPALRQLLLRLQFVGGLPPQWAAGFRRLTRLSLVDTRYEHLSAEKMSAPHGPFMGGDAKVFLPVPSDAPPALGPLPLAWAAGFPALERLQLEGLGLTGAIPRQWAAGGMPKLVEL